MQSKRKKQRIQSEKIEYSFTSKRLTMFSGMAPLYKFFDTIGLPDEFESHFQTPTSNALKFRNSQLMLAVVAASLYGVSRMSNITTFTSDILVKSLLDLPAGINKDVISTRF
ncbi:hypothetical protein JW998_07765 [candidate division KSB1 bacterium]|nr:hypothetical protein [candidate division KSB1 bacterium]